MPTMTRARHKPRVILACPANVYTGDDERIIEFSFPRAAGKDGMTPGGLISFRYGSDGQPPRVEIYRTDGQVRVIAPEVCRRSKR